MLNKENELEQTKFKLHLIPDHKGATVLHNCIKQSYSRAADSILMTIGSYPLDDHVIYIKDIMKDLLMLCPVSMAKYFEMRVIQPAWAISQT